MSKSKPSFLHQVSNKSIVDDKVTVHEESIIDGPKGLTFKMFHQEGDKKEKISPEEIKFVKSISNNYSMFDLLYMTTLGARKVLNLDLDILGPNSKAKFVVLDEKSLKPLYISN